MLTHTEIEGFTLKNYQIDSVVTERGEIRTDFVVIASGAWSP